MSERKERDNYNRKYRAVYEPVFKGVRRCLHCGFAEDDTEDDKNQHQNYHSLFVTAKLLFGDDTLTYLEIKEKELELTNLSRLLRSTKEELIKEIAVERIIELIEILEFNESLRAGDYSKVERREGTPHPSKDDYIKLLWNTKEFLTKIVNYLPLEYVLKRMEDMKGEEKLRVSSFFMDDGFPFVRVEKSTDITDELIEYLSSPDEISERRHSNDYFRERGIKLESLIDFCIS